MKVFYSPTPSFANSANNGFFFPFPGIFQQPFGPIIFHSCLPIIVARKAPV
jgi:hypothetical protein